MKSALSWAYTNVNHPSITILFCADSKSLYQALILSNSRIPSIHSSMNCMSSSIMVHLIPGHSGISGSELAKKSVKEATSITTNAILPVSFSSSMLVINETIRDDRPTHECITLIYRHQKVSCDSKQIKNQEDDVLFAHL